MGEVGPEVADMEKDMLEKPIPTKPQMPNNALARFGEKIFQVYGRGSTYMTELRAGLVLFMTSAYILGLNPLILSGGASAFNTGMKASDVAQATAISTGAATTIMGLVANYPWVVSVQLGTNSYFVQNVLKINYPCGAHATMRGPDQSCFDVPCTCPSGTDGTVNITVTGTPELVAACANSTSNGNTCVGTQIPYEMALAATFIEGAVFLVICITGLRSFIIKLIPRTILMAGAAGIGVFITFVGVKGMGLISAAPFPTLLQLSTTWPYVGNQVGDSGLGFNSCELYYGGPPYGLVCPWLAVGGLIFTGILLVWNVNGAFIMGIFFTMFISWAIFPDKIGQGGMVPNQIVAVPGFSENGTLLTMDFNWGPYTGELIAAFVTFLYLDFIGSSITFVSLGQMQGIVNDEGDLPRSNIAFLSDSIGSMLGGMLGSSALTTYVESAAAVKEGGRTGLTALVCAVLFFVAVFLWPLFSIIPDVATSPVLALIGCVIFMSAIMELDWTDYTEAIPAFTTILGMPFTSNIAYGVIGGIFMYIVCKFVTFSLCKVQQKWPGYKWIQGRHRDNSMFTSIPGWNADANGNKLTETSTEDQDLSLLTLLKWARKKSSGSAPAPQHMAKEAEPTLADNKDVAAV